MKVFLNKEFVDRKIIEMNVTKGFVAKKLRLSQCLFSLYLCGHVSLRPDKRIKMLSFFGAEFNELFVVNNE